MVSPTGKGPLDGLYNRLVNRAGGRGFITSSHLHLKINFAQNSDAARSVAVKRAVVLEVEIIQLKHPE